MLLAALFFAASPAFAQDSPEPGDPPAVEESAEQQEQPQEEGYPEAPAPVVEGEQEEPVAESEPEPSDSPAPQEETPEPPAEEPAMEEQPEQEQPQNEESSESPGEEPAPAPQDPQEETPRDNQPAEEQPTPTLEEPAPSEPQGEEQGSENQEQEVQEPENLEPTEESQSDQSRGVIDPIESAEPEPQQESTPQSEPETVPESVPEIKIMEEPAPQPEFVQPIPDEPAPVFDPEPESAPDSPVASSPVAPEQGSEQGTPQLPSVSLEEGFPQIVDLEGLDSHFGEEDADEGESKEPADEGEEESDAAPVEKKKEWWRSGYTTLAAFLLVLLISGFLADRLSKAWKMPEYYIRIFVLLLCFLGGMVSTVLGLLDNRLTLGIDLRGGVILVYDVVEKAKEDDSGAPAKDSEPQDPVARSTGGIDMDQLTRALGMRINPGGVREISITKLGSNQIRIIIPKAEDAEVARIERVISESGTLEFRILASPKFDKDLPIIDRARNEQGTTIYENIDGKQVRVAFWVPVSEGERAQFEGNTSVITRTRKSGLEVLVLHDKYNVRGDDIRRIYPTFDERQQQALGFELNGPGGRKFYALTNENKKDPVQQERVRQLGILMNGQLYSAPNLNSAIRDSGMIIFGQRSTSEERAQLRQEIEHLMNVMEAGSLPADLSEKPVSRMVTGATLGEDTINKGMNSVLLGGAVVLIFMVLYYRFAGFVACFAVIMNFFLIMAVMLALRSAFTLPGLAGLVLTLGMAVDANILIFERIREELNHGASLRMAIRNGFDRAFSAIIDSNCTTLISGLILYAVGNEQIKGFAVTLVLGVSFSMFTSIYCCRTIFDVCERRRWITNLKMAQIFVRPNYDFMGKKRFCLVFSATLIIISILATMIRGRDILDLDFVGGVSVEAVFNKPMDIAKIRGELYEPLDNPAVSPIQLDSSAAASAEKETGIKTEDNTHFIINMKLRSDSPTENFTYLSDVLKEKFANDLVYHTFQYEIADSFDSATEADPQGRTTLVNLTVEPIMNQLAITSKIEAIMQQAVKDKELENQFNFLIEPREKADLRISDENLSSGGLRSNRWILTLNTSRENAEILMKLGETISHEPYFPTSTTIGGAVAKHARWEALLAITGSLICIIAYIWLRFHRVVYGFAAVIALVHDVIITLGLIALSKWLTHVFMFAQVYEFKIGLSEVAAFLTIIGYSLNDTIVLFDRIRETKGKLPNLTEDLINRSINQNLSRTILTSLSTLFVLVILYFFGGLGIHTFAFTLMMGIIVGTYSSIFIATVMLYYLSETQEQIALEKKNITNELNSLKEKYKTGLKSS